MKKITAILLFLLISLPHAQAADRLLLKNGLACLKRFELSYDVAFFRYSSKLVDKSTYRSWAEVVEETFENAGKKTVFDLIENREFELAHKKLLIELENNGPLKFDIIKGSKEYLIIKKLITNNNPEAVKLSLFLTGHFSPNPFLSRDSNLKLAQFYKCLGEKQFYPNTIFPFHLIFEKPNHKSACTQYQKSPEILDPCGIGTGGSGGGSGGDLPMEYIGSYDAGGGFVGHAFEADISGNSPINEIGGGPDLGTLGFSGPGATGEPGGGIPTSPTGNNDQSEEENQPENQRDSNSESDSEAKSEFEKEVEGALSKIADEGLKESIKRAMDDVENENEKKRDAQKEAILNSFNILIPRKILTPEEERVLRSLQRGENPGRAAVESLNNEKPRHYEFASENGDFLDRAENLYKKVSNIKSQGVTGEHPLSLRNIRNKAKHLSLATIEASDQANFLGDEVAANTGLEIAEALADVALGVTPGLSIVSDAYSFFYGKHVLFGTELSVSDRVFAGIGLLTLGGSNWLKHGGKILGKALLRLRKSAIDLRELRQIRGRLNKILNYAGSSLRELTPDSIKRFMKIIGTKDGKYLNEFLSSLKDGTGVFGKSGKLVNKGSLNPKQARNLKRFEKKLPVKALETEVRELKDGSVVFQAEIPGNVTGSKAIYEKLITSKGETEKYFKTTYDNNGKIVHIKDKIEGEVVTPGDL